MQRSAEERKPQIRFVEVPDAQRLERCPLLADSVEKLQITGAVNLLDIEAIKNLIEFRLIGRAERPTSPRQLLPVSP
jgi:hypothetical protein